ncbi:hypothetical protein P8452_54853 [Trifolium repens]|nr:hypothetical protein P8452_54853 [Trifolium repens]
METTRNLFVTIAIFFLAFFIIASDMRIETQAARIVSEKDDIVIRCTTDEDCQRHFLCKFYLKPVCAKTYCVCV